MPDLHDSASESHGRASGSGDDPAQRLGIGVNEHDTLSDVLRTVRLTGALFFLWEVAPRFATPVPAGRAFAPLLVPGAQEVVSYHVVTDGACWGGLVGGPPMRLEAGDILLIPRGDAYVIASSEHACRTAREDVEGALAFFRQMAAGALPFVIDESGGGQLGARIACGFLGCDLRPFNPALATLPALVRIARRRGPSGDRLESLIRYTLTEAREPRAGSACVLLRLSELLFVEVIRRYVADAPDAEFGWLAAMRDPVAGKALALLHQRPATTWTVDRLATQTGVSRSRLAESFTRLVGQPPMHYLASWRMQLAARALADEPVKVAAIAREVGYASEAAFSRAFKRAVGVSPAAWRRSAAIPERARTARLDASQ